MWPKLSQGFIFIAMVWIICGIVLCILRSDSALFIALFTTIGYAIVTH